MRFSGASFVGPLDDYTSGLKIAWDVRRRLLSSYTGALFEVRADRSGQPTFDVPFKADGTWDTAALLSFAGSDSCYVTQVYPQIGSIVFAQATAANQPRIVNAGVLNANGIKFEFGRNLSSSIVAADWTGSSGTAYQIVCNMHLSTGAGGGLWTNQTDCGGYVNAYGGLYFDSPARINTGPIADNASHVYSQEKSNPDAAIRVNGTVVVSSGNANGTATGSSFVIGDNSAFGFSGSLSSWCIWDNTTDAAGRAAALA
jgi:hypothetical protein